MNLQPIPPLWMSLEALHRRYKRVLGTADSSVSSSGTPVALICDEFDAFASIIREEGVLGLYKGLIPSLLLTFNGALQLTIYEYLKSRSAHITSPLSNILSLCYPFDAGPRPKSEGVSDGGVGQPASLSVLLGGVSKALATVLTYPYQVVKTRLQQRERLGYISEHRTSAETGLEAYKGTFDCLFQIYRHEGLRGYFKGLVPHSLRVAPSAALTFLVYEECLKFLKKV
eukprot:gene10-11_t